MGPTVLDPGAAKTPGIHTYAQCLRNVPGGVALLVINANPKSATEISLPQKSDRFTLSSLESPGTDVQLNGTTLSLGPNDSLPALQGVVTPVGPIALPPVSITFFTFRGINNSNCK